MAFKQTPDMDVNAKSRRWWVLIFCVSLFFLALSWSIDPSIVYIISGAVAFSLFKIVQLRKKEWEEVEEDESDERQPFRGSRSQKPRDLYEQYRPSAFSSFLEEVKQLFKKNSRGSGNPQQSKGFVILVAGFIGFVFMFSILGSLLEGENSSNNFYFAQRAEEYYNIQQYDSAAYYYRLAIESDPDNVDLYVQRGNSFLNAQNEDSAIVMYDQAIDIDPANMLALYNKAYVYFDRKNYQQSIDQTRKVLAIEPEHTDALLLTGDCFYNLNQPDSALYWYEGAYATGFRSSILCQLMAGIYDSKGQQETAINLYKEAIQQDSSIVAIYSRLGELIPGEEGNWYRTKAAAMSSN